MSLETAKVVLASRHPKGLKRFVLTVLALYATDGGQLPFGEADQQRWSDELRMDFYTRFSRIVEELRYEGFVSIDGTTLTLYAGDQRGAAVGGESPQTSLLQSQALAQGRGIQRGDEKKPQDAVSDVLSFYVATFGPRKWGEEDKREVRAALEIASVLEIQEAIQGNKLSAYHQGENPKGKKYNTLGHIIRGKQGKRTRRENIDMFREILEKARASSGGIKAAASGADPAIIKTRKEEVRRSHRLAHDQEAQERGSRAEAWLREQGIETKRKPDGYPIWPEGGGA